MPSKIAMTATFHGKKMTEKNGRRTSNSKKPGLGVHDLENVEYHGLSYGHTQSLIAGEFNTTTPKMAAQGS
jgi:hypothetical protein